MARPSKSATMPTYIAMAMNKPEAPRTNNSKKSDKEQEPPSLRGPHVVARLTPELNQIERVANNLGRCKNH